LTGPMTPIEPVLTKTTNHLGRPSTAGQLVSLPSVIMAAMIRVRLFASLREAAGISELTLPADRSLTAAEVFDLLVSQRPGLAPMRPVTLVAVNDEFAGWNTPVSPDGDEVAFFPPVSGGAAWFS
jgi:molybdopterin converting factor subunit 1